MSADRPKLALSMDELESLAFNALKATGLSDEHAGIIKDVLLYAELFHWFLGPAMLLLLLERLAVATRLRRIP